MLIGEWKETVIAFSDLYGRGQLDVRMYFNDRDLQPVNARSIVMRDKKIWAGE